MTRTSRSRLPREVIASVVCVLAVVAVLWFCYQPAFQGPLILDDRTHLTPLYGGENFPRSWQHILFSGGGHLGRPVAMLSFIHSAWLFGGDISYWKLTNLLIHQVNFLAILCVSFLILSQYTKASGGRIIAMVVATVWALHPLQVSTVMYTVQRMTELSAFFTILGMLCYALGRQKQIIGQPGSGWIAVAFGLAFPLAAFSKENGLLFPYYALLMEYFFFRFAGNTKTKKLLAVCYAFTVVFPVMLLIIYFSFFGASLFNAYEWRPFTLTGRLLTESRVLMLYLYQILIPTNAKLTFFYDDFVISKGLFEPVTTVISLLALPAMAYTAFTLRRNIPLVGFGILFYLVGHALESTIFPLELIYEHRNYLPSFGIIIAVVGLMLALPIARSVKALFAIFAIGLLCVTTLLRTEIWSSAAHIYAHAVKYRPASTSAMAQLAELLTQERRYDDAIKLLGRSAGSGASLHKLYVQCLATGRLQEQELQSATDNLEGVLGSYAITAVVEVGRQGVDNKCQFSFEVYLQLLERALQHKLWADRISRFKLTIYEAHYYWRLGNSNSAIAALQRAHQTAPEDPMPLFLAVEWLVQLGRLEEAHEYYARAVDLSRQSEIDYSELVTQTGKLLTSPAK